MTIVVRFDDIPDRSAAAQAANCIRSGGTLIFPTDTVYGIGCAPEDEGAIEEIFRAKGRDGSKPLAIHIAHPDEVWRFAQEMTPGARAIVDRLWPGPIAIIVARRDGACSAAARGGSTISLRCPGDVACRAILEATGPLAATSANRSGRRPFDGDAAQLDRLPEAALALIARGRLAGKESTVLDCTGTAATILRQGAVTVRTIRRALSGAAALTP